MNKHQAAIITIQNLNKMKMLCKGLYAANMELWRIDEFHKDIYEIEKRTDRLKFKMEQKLHFQPDEVKYGNSHADTSSSRNSSNATKKIRVF